MKRYKLLKDLPTFKAGEEFYIDDSGNLISAGHGTVVAYAESTLKKFPNILKNWFEETEEYKRWRAREGGDYWFIDSFGYASENKDYRTSVSNHYYRIGNYFKTEAEAEKCGEYLKALQTIKDDAKGYRFNDKDVFPAKAFGFYDFEKNDLDYSVSLKRRVQGVVYFSDAEDIKASFEKHRKEWLTVLGVENENR